MKIPDYVQNTLFIFEDFSRLYSIKIPKSREQVKHSRGQNSGLQEATQKTTYAWYLSLVDWCVGKVCRMTS